MFANREQQNQIDHLNNEVIKLQTQVRAMSRDNAKAHDRIDQVNLRTANIEHYTGMRSHSFENGGRMWNYMQIHKDINARQRPQSLFVSKSRVAQAA
ncbi:hypothetical protein HC000_02100 [Pseudoalteromonas sp. MIP2626]|uniref:hypothetical protein n=1 Tax=Pseudoalteromonas sp. MIP2626 TaxID=2705464 RepID=UPI0015C9F8F3|nr:hypothetical protein [Pseudoalteromonas sp. MIP2626]NYR11292.1 hypothetical protein [Pseudoalteromonas sp. MIP2626]